MTHPQPFLLEAGQPFTLWMDPARWPLPPLRLPGHAFTLWTRPKSVPAPVLQLPGRAHTVWLDPVRWPVARLRLPAAGHTVWLDPDKWPALPPVVDVAPMVEPKLVPVSSLTEAPLSVEAPQRAGAVLDPIPEPVPTTAGPEVLPILYMPITIPQNKAFTLWTRPQYVSPVPMKNGLTAAQVAAEASPAVAARTGLDHSVGKTAPAPEAVLPVSHGGVWEKWLPLAAAAVAVLGVHALTSVAGSRREAGDAAQVIQMRDQIGEASKGMAGMKTQLAADTAAFGEKTALMEANAKVLKEQKDLLVTELAKAMDASRKAEAKLAEQEVIVRQLAMDLEKAKLESSTAGTAAEGRVVAAMEEASKIKRVAEAEVIVLKEALAKSEAEKAAALKAAAQSAAALPAEAPAKP